MWNKMINGLGWMITIALILIGALGYIEKLFNLEWNTRFLWMWLAVFLILSVAQVCMTVYEKKKSAEDFYSQEQIEVFERSTSRDLIRFFNDPSGNKCAAFVLKKEPIPKSVKLWEGGYDAPPITLAFHGKEVIFKHSHYSNYEEYVQQNGPVYQIRYFPKP